MTEVIENDDSLNVDEELDLELEPEILPPAEDVEALKQQLAESQARERRLFARVKKQQPKDQPTLNKQPPKELEVIREVGTRLSTLELAEAKRQFGYEHGLSPAETDKVFAITSKPTKETLEDPFIKAGLEAIRAANRVAEATPSPSGRAATFNGKTFADMNPEERQKAMEARFKR
jgi:hypothetical protein